MSRPEPQPNISSFDTLNSETDYEKLYKQLENIPGINTVWRMKYYHLLFPTLLAPFYGQDIQLKVLHFLKQNPSSIPFIRMGQYVKNKEFELKNCEHTVSGMLLYAETDENIFLNNTYQMNGNQISAQTLNLNQNFSNIARDLDCIVELNFGDKI